MGKNKKEYNVELDRIYGNNKIWCNNKTITGSKYYNMLLTFFLYSLPYILSIIFFLKLGPLKLYLNIIYIIISSILYIIHIFSMIKGGFTDPGILPRQNADIYYTTSRTNMRYRINGHMFRINYCYSCYLFRPPRTSHCAVCDNCVERFDHHCLWLGNCVGKKNYKYFYCLLGSLNINAIIQIIFCLWVLLIEIQKIKNKENKGYAFITVIGSIILYNALFLGIFIGKLFILHTYLVLKGLTFYEYSKEKMNVYPEGVNPYNKYKFFSKKCILFRTNEKSNILSALQKNKRLKNGIEINKISKFKKKIYKEEKNSVESVGPKIKYLKTYQQYQSSYSKKKNFGNNMKKWDKKKHSDENNINSSKRTIGPITMDFKKVLNNQEKQMKNIISSSEGSKDIDFDKNVNVVINPYCIILNKKKLKQQNDVAVTTGRESQNKKIKKIIIEENENKKEAIAKRKKNFVGNNKIIFTNIEKNNDDKNDENNIGDDQSDNIKISED